MSKYNKAILAHILAATLIGQTVLPARAMVVGGELYGVDQQANVYRYQPTEQLNYAPGEVLVLLREGVAPDAAGSLWQSAPSVASILSRYGAGGLQPLVKLSNWSSTLQSRYLNMLEAQRAFLLNLRQGLSRLHRVKMGTARVEDVLAELRNDPNVLLAEPNYRVHLQLAPNDPYYASKGTWGQTYDDLWGIKAVNAAAAWDVTQGQGVTVAVIDTGMDRTHPDLAANIWTNPQEIAGNGIDDDGNGLVDDVYGWNFYGNNNDLTDENGHGTHVAGTIAGIGNNGEGVIGIAPKAKIMGLRGFDRSGTSTIAGLVDALHYAADMGADVINASWGAAGSSIALKTAIEYAHAAGVVVVVSAGNDSREAEYNNPGMYGAAITVGALDPSLNRASYSNYGAKIDVAAPGSDILSALAPNSWMEQNLAGQKVGSKYLRLSGTSMAAPHVAGVAALVLAKNPGYTPEQVRAVLRASAADRGVTGWDPVYGYGRVDALAAVNTSAVPARVYGEITSPHVQNPAPQHRYGKGTIAINGSANGVDFSRYTVSYGRMDNDALPTSFQTITTATSPITNGTLANWDTSAVADGRYLIRLNVANAAGKGTDLYTVFFKDATLKTGFPKLVSWYKGHPGGWRYLNNPQTPTLADLDGDGQMEIITVDERWVYVFRADGSAYPNFPQSVPNNIGAMPTVADLDGDGKPEILLYSRGTTADQPIYAFRANGTLMSGFPTGKLSAGGVPTSGYVYIDYSPLIVADLDGDGKVEIVYLSAFWNNGSNGGMWLNVLSNTGTQKTGWPKKLPTEDTHAFRPPVVGDLDGDGKLEIIVSQLKIAQGAQLIQVYNADGSLRKERSFANVPNVGAPKHFDTLLDFNLDGKRELYTMVYGNNGDTYVHALDKDLSTLSGWPKTLPYGRTYSFGDLEGDGDIEVLAITGQSGNALGNVVAALHHNGTAVSGFPKALGQIQGMASVGDTSNLVSAPITKSPRGAFFGISEINDQGSNRLHQNGLIGLDAQGNPLAGFPKAMPPTFAHPAIADLDRDGALEIVVHSEDGMLYAWSEVAPSGAALPVATVYGGNTRTGSVNAAAFWQCRTVTATNGDHVTAGRATSKTSLFTTTWYANGSNDNLGTSRTTSTTLAQTQPGYYIKGQCPAAPTVDSISAAVSGASVTVSGKASDANNDLARVEVQFDGGAWLAASGTTTWSLSKNDLSLGSHSVKARAVDAGGRSSAETAAVTFTTSSNPSQPCVTAKNTVHISEGRAYQCGTTYSPKACANGSNNDLGSSSTYFPATTSIKQTGSNYWIKVASCS